MGRGRARVVVFVLVVALAAACSDSVPVHPTAAAARQLRRAADRTLAASSYKLRIDQGSVKHPHDVTTEYQAPDRTLTRSRSVDSVSIGNTSYLRGPGGSKMFTRSTIPATSLGIAGYPNYATSTIASALYPAQHAQNGVSVQGDTLIATTPKRGVFGRARYIYRVSDGRITDLRIEQKLRGKPYNRELRYYDFGVRNVIEPPPADQVQTSVPPTPCPASGVPPPNEGCFGPVTTVPTRP